jgi:hypothetical protein
LIGQRLEKISMILKQYYLGCVAHASYLAGLTCRSASQKFLVDAASLFTARVLPLFDCDQHSATERNYQSH